MVTELCLVKLLFVFISELLVIKTQRTVFYFSSNSRLSYKLAHQFHNVFLCYNNNNNIYLKSNIQQVQ